VRLAFVHAEKESFPIAAMCRVFGVSRQGYYAYVHRPPSARVLSEVTLFEAIRAIFRASGETYGSPRVLRELQGAGFHVGKRRVERAMRSMGITPPPISRRVPRTTIQDRTHPVAPNELARDFTATRPNERWVTDVLVGPYVPWPRVASSVRAKLFLIVDDHSRLLVDGQFYAHENARACQELLRRAIVHRGVPEVLYADNGGPFKNAWLTRTCAVLGVRLVHSRPYSPEGRGKQERLNRYIREAFLAEATHRGIESMEELNELFSAWATQVANRRVHAETKEQPIERFERSGPHRAVDPDRLAEAFRWSVTRKVTRTATVPLEGNSYSVDPSLVARRVELRYEPEDLSRIEVYFEGRPAGTATPFVTARHVHRAVPQAERPAPEQTGVDYLGLVAAAHEEEAGTGQKIDFAQLQMFPAEEELA